MKTKTVEIRLFGILIYKKTTEHKCTVDVIKDDKQFVKKLTSALELVIQDFHKAV